MMISSEVLEIVLHENGINRTSAKMIIEHSKLAMLERLTDVQSYINNLYIKAIELSIKPTHNGTISEHRIPAPARAVRDPDGPPDDATAARRMRPAGRGRQTVLP